MFAVMDVLQGLLFSITFITASYSCYSPPPPHLILVLKEAPCIMCIIYIICIYNIYDIYVKDSISLYPSPLHTQSPGQKGSPRLRHFGFVLQWETSLTLPGRRTNTVMATTTTATSSRLRMPTMIFFCSHHIQVGESQKCQFDSRDTHLLSLSSLVVGWVCAAWQCHAWQAALGSWAERRTTRGCTQCLPRSPLPLYSTLARRCQQAHTSLFQKTHGRTWEKERNGEIGGGTSRSGTFCASLAHEHLVELKFVCFTSISRCLNAPKSQPGLLLNKWSFWYTGKWLNWRSWGYKLMLENCDNTAVWV